MAEGVGFEPTLGFPLSLISSQVPSTTQPPFHYSNCEGLANPCCNHLLQYGSNGNYYGRIKTGGKIIRESLDIDVWTSAKLRLTDFLKKRQEARFPVNFSHK